VADWVSDAFLGLLDPRNGKSVGVAEKLGFKQEGTLRWVWVMPQGEPENRSARRERRLKKSGEGQYHDGRDSVLLSYFLGRLDGGVRKL
jgi:RimJ/RimL family protein N-acetyltransferase